ncbi:MAG: DUF3530 family protein [Methylomonas sp.]|nr:DUF3530 family protein [Methylomonas sp.]PPD22608.1 MAG: phospholipase [Methylomonas sp.]PPD27918.1 MAG: phospholipase [Methylomonas sp.]PPD40028.1 MAG: phospholipase [Methylomonas sp.]PPD41584.1 MAG: phospholipase [Methylomonas sp.]
MIHVFVVVASMVCLQAASASDSQREADLADALRKTLALGRAISLNANGDAFLAIHTEAEKTDDHFAAIILHDLDAHPDQKPLIHELRTSLPLRNIATLSIMLPLREAGADDADYLPLFEQASARIKAAIDHLKQQGGQQIALIGHGLGAQMALFHLSAHPENVAAFVAIGLPVVDDAPPQGRTIELIPRVALPFLDIYAEFDEASVQNSARMRRMAGKDNPVFRQIRMAGENHGHDRDAVLTVKRVYSWLATTFDFNKL